MQNQVHKNIPKHNTKSGEATKKRFGKHTEQQRQAKQSSKVSVPLFVSPSLQSRCFPQIEVGEALRRESEQNSTRPTVYTTVERDSERRFALWFKEQRSHLLAAHGEGNAALKQ